MPSHPAKAKSQGQRPRWMSSTALISNMCSTWTAGRSAGGVGGSPVDYPGPPFPIADCFSQNFCLRHNFGLPRHSCCLVLSNLLPLCGGDSDGCFSSATAGAGCLSTLFFSNPFCNSFVTSFRARAAALFLLMITRCKSLIFTSGLEVTSWTTAFPSVTAGGTVSPNATAALFKRTQKGSGRLKKGQEDKKLKKT